MTKASNISAELAELQEICREREKKETSFLPLDHVGKQSIKGIIFALLTALAYALASVLAKRATLLTGNEQLAIAFAVSSIFVMSLMHSKRLSPLGVPSQRLFLILAAIASLVGRNTLYMSMMIIAPSDLLALVNANIFVTSLLARIFFNERLTSAHLISLVLIVAGVLLIAKPCFILVLFESSPNNMTNPFDSVNGSSPQQTKPTFEYGVALALLTAIAFSFLSITVKKACMLGAHWSVVTAYGNYFGMPAGIVISVVMYARGLTHVGHKWSDNRALYAEHLAWSLASAFFNACGTLTWNVALSCEDAAKVSMLKASDVLISFVLQWLVLGLAVDVWSLSGTVAILVAVLLILSAKMLDKHQTRRIRLL